MKPSIKRLAPLHKISHYGDRHNTHHTSITKKLINAYYQQGKYVPRL